MIQIPGSFKSFIARSCRRLNPAFTGKFLAVLAILGLAALVPAASAQTTALSCQLDGPGTLCKGETATIQASVFGCDSQNLTYAWTIPQGLHVENGGNSNSDFVEVRANQTGDFTISLSVTCNGVTCHPCEITVHVPNPPVCDISGPSQNPVCGSTGNTLSLDISGGNSPYDITWSIDSNGIADGWAITGGQGTKTLTFTAGQNGSNATFTAHVRDENGCESECHITVSCSACVEVNAGGPYETCGTQCVQLNGTIGGSATSGHWTTSGSGSFQPNADTIDATYCPSQNDVNAGHVTLTLTTNDPEGPCQPDHDQADLTVRQAPLCDINPPATPVCGSTGNTMHVNVSGGNSPYDITWSINGAGIADGWAITGGQGTSTITYTAGNNGTDATFHVTVRDQSGCECESDVTLNCSTPGPCVEVNAGGPYEQCVPINCPPNTHCVQLNGTIGGQATSGHWTSSGTGNFLPNADTIDALYCPSQADLAAGHVTLTLTTNDPEGPCGPDSDTAELTVLEAPTCDINQPVTTPVCGSSGNTLHVSVTGGNSPYTYEWSINSAGLNDNWAITGGQGTATITYRAGDTGSDATFHVTVRDESGCESECSLIVTCGQAGPCVSVDAGGPYDKCVPANCPVNTHCIQLNGTIGGQATSGHWTTSGSGTFQPNADTIDALYCPSAADLAAGQVTLTLTTNDPAGECGPDSDTAVLTLHEGPFCDLVPPSQTPVCGSSGNTLHVNISGGDTPYTITWSLNSAALSDNWAITGGQGTSTITYRAGDTGTDATFHVTVRDEKGCETECSITISCGAAGPCVSVNAGGPYEECIPQGDPLSEHCVELNGTIGGQATSGHWTTSGSGTFQPNANTIDATYCPSSGDLNAGHVTLTLTTNDPAGECGPDSDSATLTLTRGPVCDIDNPSQNPVCGSSGNTLHVNISGGNSPYDITWSLNSAALSDNWAITGGQGTSTITYRAGDTGTDATFTVHVRDESGCESQCHLTISCGAGGPCVTVNAGGPYEECIPEGTSPSGHCVQLNGTIGGQATSGHWTTSGSGTFQPNANTIDALYCPSSSDVNAGHVTLTLTTNNPEGECDAESDQATVTFNRGGAVCDIDEPSQNPECGSTGNSLHVDISGGNPPYDIHWSINSAGLNDNWAITGGQGTATLTYRAGNNQAIITVTITDEDGCETTCNITLHCGPVGPPPSNVCSVTQGYWGNEGGKKCFQGQKMGTLEILDALITSGSPLTVGMAGRSVTFGEGSEECIIELLPGGGSPTTLPSNLGNATVNSGSCQTSPELPLKDGRINNVLLSQTITLALNVRFSSDLADFDLMSSGSPVSLSLAAQNALDDLGLGTTVGDILELANRALAGQDTGGLSLSAVNGLVDSINEGFEGECGDCGDSDEDSSVRLLGNNPNPFAINGSTVITFSLQSQSVVNLEVFDISGRRVATLVNSTLPAGINSARFDAAGYPGLPSGIYMYRLNARVVGTGETHVKAEKMLLIR